MDKLKNKFEGSIKRIISLQKKDGSIPWTKDGAFDAWNHLECVMALNIFRYTKQVDLGFNYLRQNQLDDGSWLGELGSTQDIDKKNGTFVKKEKNDKTYYRDTNFAAYIATATWHDFLINNSIDRLLNNWEMIERGIDFVISNQMDNGSIRWAAKSSEAPNDDSLLTGCCSIYKSLICAINCASRLNMKKPLWESALWKLEDAIKNKPYSFDKTWESKKRFSMDWYYPVLCGVIKKKDAEKRIKSEWKNFVLSQEGCLCVNDQPWITIAETAELAITLIKIKKKNTAKDLLLWIDDCRDDDGAYWMGKQVVENIFWPMEKPGWTSAAVILAHDALNNISKGSTIFLNDKLI